MTLGSVATKNRFCNCSFANCSVNYRKLICSYLFIAVLSKLHSELCSTPITTALLWNLQLSFGLLKHSSVCWSCKGGRGGQGLIQHPPDWHEWELDLTSGRFSSVSLNKAARFFLCLSCFGLFCFLGYFLPWGPMILNREKSNLQATFLSQKIFILQ